MRDEDLDMELSALLDGELPPERERRLRERVAADPRLRERLAALESVDVSLREIPATPLPSDLRARLQQRIEQLESTRESPPLQSRIARARWGVPLAAALAAGLVAVLFIQAPTDPDVAPARQPDREPQPALASGTASETMPEIIPRPIPQANPERAAAAEHVADLAPPAAEQTETLPRIEEPSDEELAIAFELETLRDLDLIQELDLLEVLLEMETMLEIETTKEERG